MGPRSILWLGFEHPKILWLGFEHPKINSRVAGIGFRSNTCREERGLYWYWAVGMFGTVVPERSSVCLAATNEQNTSGWRSGGGAAFNARRQRWYDTIFLRRGRCGLFEVLNFMITKHNNDTHILRGTFAASFLVATK